jgi:hypothetical protein
MCSSWPGLSPKSGLPDLGIIYSEVAQARLLLPSTPSSVATKKGVDARHPMSGLPDIGIFNAQVG